jgi:LPXTG-motif cell wall-anchored protein
MGALQRRLVAAVLAASVLSGTAGAETRPAVTITGSPVAAGSSVEVSGTGCGADAVVFVGVLDPQRAGELAKASTGGGGDAGWKVSITVPATTRPGRYPVTARCSSSYAGYTGYDGYGGGGFDYSEGTVEVRPPDSVPAADGPLTITPSTAPPRATVRVSGGGYGSGEQVTLILYSSPVVLGVVTTGTDGTFSSEVLIPEGTPLGRHDVVSMNATSTEHPPRTLRAALTVTAAAQVGPVTTVQRAVQTNASPAPTVTGSLPMTGLEPWLTVLAGLAALGAGLALLVSVRRRDAAGEAPSTR